MTQDQINELKAKHGKIYKLTINETDWYYRTMSRTEFKEYSVRQIENAQNLTEFDLEDMIFDICCLNGVKSSEIKEAGVVTLVSSEIMKATGFVDDIQSEEL